MKYNVKKDECEWFIHVAGRKEFSRKYLPCKSDLGKVCNVYESKQNETKQEKKNQNKTKNQQQPQNKQKKQRKKERVNGPRVL